MNMLTTVAPKSDQMNADDLICGPKTIKITKVSIASGDQPVSLHYEGDEGKPFKPCKTIRRVLIQVWGKDANAYIGRFMTLYRDDTVKFGGAIVGGIRISHMSDIAEPITMALTATRAQRKPYTVKPLLTDSTTQPSSTEPTPIDRAIALCKITTSQEELEQIAKDSQKLKGWNKDNTEAMKAVLKHRRAEFKQQSEERQPGE